MSLLKQVESKRGMYIRSVVMWGLATTVSLLVFWDTLLLTVTGIAFLSIADSVPSRAAAPVRTPDRLYALIAPRTRPALEKGYRAVEVVRFPSPESATDSRQDYSVALLQAALNRTVVRYGPAKVEYTDGVINESRRWNLLSHGSSELDVMVRPTTADMERVLTPIRFPIDKGLLGFRILLIRRKDQLLFSKVRTIQQLKRFKAGMGRDWADASIYAESGLPVVTGAEYEGLFEMLVKHRFDYFPRAVIEALPEYDAHAAALPDLAVETDLVLHYPFARYFWVAKNSKGDRLRKRITEGLEKMVKDGSFDRLFWQFYGRSIERAALKHRRLLTMRNSMLPASVPINRRELWFNPMSAIPDAASRSDGAVGGSRQQNWKPR